MQNLKPKSNHAEDLWPNDPLTRRRYELTLEFMNASTAALDRILDLGTPNPLGEILKQQGLEVINTSGDLDLKPEVAARSDVDAVTAFEILEHLVAPFNVLRALEAPRLFATIPLRLWFATAYRNPADPWDRHFHEFEDWQFDWLLEKAGWSIVRSEKWTGPTRSMGVRPLLRKFTPRFYAVEAVRSKEARRVEDSLGAKP